MFLWKLATPFHPLVHHHVPVFSVCAPGGFGSGQTLRRCVFSNIMPVFPQDPYGGVQSMGVSGNHPVVMDDHVSIETHGDLGITHFQNPPYIHIHVCITLHYITLHYITLQYITLHYITLHYVYTYIYIYTVGAGIIERKLRSTKVRLFTVPCCSIILFSSEGVKKKNVYEFTPNFFRRSTILVGALLFYNYVFPHFIIISYHIISYHIIYTIYTSYSYPTPPAPFRPRTLPKSQSSFTAAPTVAISPKLAINAVQSPAWAQYRATRSWRYDMMFQ